MFYYSPIDRRYIGGYNMLLCTSQKKNDRGALTQSRNFICGTPSTSDAKHRNSEAEFFEANIVRG